MDLKTKAALIVASKILAAICILTVLILGLAWFPKALLCIFLVFALSILAVVMIGGIMGMYEEELLRLKVKDEDKNK